MTGGKLYICFESEFGILPKNSGLNPWYFQFWGGLGVVWGWLGGGSGWFGSGLAPWLGSLRQVAPPPPHKENDGWIRQCAELCLST